MAFYAKTNGYTSFDVPRFIRVIWENYPNTRYSETIAPVTSTQAPAPAPAVPVPEYRINVCDYIPPNKYERVSPTIPNAPGIPTVPMLVPTPYGMYVQYVPAHMYAQMQTMQNSPTMRKQFF